MCDRASEIALFVALAAGRLSMFSDQTIFRGVVIKFPGRTIVLPASGIVTAIALAAEFHLLECAVVRIVMTGLAAVESDPFKENQLLRWIAIDKHKVDLRLAGLRCSGPGMAFRTGNLLMLTGKRKRRAGMVESSSRLPGLLVVTSEAVGGELILMWLLVA